MNATPGKRERTCGRCGQSLPADASGTPCPRCALAHALDGQQETVAMERPAENALPPGTPVRYFGDYEILGELARGAMGIVYRARQISLNRLVALKMIQAGRFASPEAVQRFRIEAEAAAQLDHPNIVPVYEVGQHEGYRFLSMRLLEGGTLKDRIASLGASPRTSAGLVEAVARAVHHAHQRGVLHRDLKPANILLDAQGHPFVADFGLARLQEEESGLTHSGTVLGTPHYMAPEQAAGHARHVSAASDVYGLGAILYHLLCGRPPLEAETPMATLRKVIDEAPASLRRCNPGLDRDIETIVLKCLEKNPERRYRSAEALADDLACWRDHRPVSARPVGPAERMGKWCRRRPAIAALTAALATAAVVGAVGFVHFTFRLREERNAAIAARGLSREAQYGALLDQARAERASDREGRRRRALDALRSAAEIKVTPELRGEAVAALGLEDFSEAVRWTLESAVPKPLCIFDRHGELLAFQASATSVCVRALSQGRLVATLPCGAPQSFSPDGQWIALRVDKDGRNALEMYRLDHPAKPAFSHPTLSQHAVAFSDDSQRAFFAGGDGALYELPLATLAPRVLGVRVEGAHRIREMPHGQCLAVSTGPEVALVDTEQPRVLTRLLLPGKVHDLAVSPDGALLACACGDRTIHLFEGRPGKVASQWALAQRPLKTSQVAVRSHWTLSGHSHDVVEVAFTAGARYLASYSLDQSTRVWDMADGRCVGVSEKELVPGLDAAHAHLGFTTPGGFGLWRVDPSRCVLVRNGWGAPHLRYSHLFPNIPPSRNNLTHVAFSADSLRAVTTGPVGCKVWDLAGTSTPVELTPSGCTSAFFIPGPTGARVLITGVQGFTLVDPLNPKDAARISDATDLKCGTIDPAGRQVAAVDEAGRIWRWDTDEPTTATVLASHRAADGIAASPGLRVVATGTREGNDVSVWDLDADRQLSTLSARGGASVAFAPDGTTLYAGSCAELSAWSATDWRKRWTRDTHGRDLPTPVTVHPAGAILAIRDRPETVALLDASSGTNLSVVSLPIPVSGGSVTFSADGTKLALAGDDEILQVVDFAQLEAELCLISADPAFLGIFAKLRHGTPPSMHGPTPDAHHDKPPSGAQAPTTRRQNLGPPTATAAGRSDTAFATVDFGPRASRRLTDNLGAGMPVNSLSGRISSLDCCAGENETPAAPIGVGFTADPRTAGTCGTAAPCVSPTHPPSALPFPPPTSSGARSAGTAHVNHVPALHAYSRQDHSDD